MRILIVGAGAIGGFIAARMQEDGLDVTLLVREGRRAQLKARGLVVRSETGDYEGQPKLLSAGEDGGSFDIVVLASKSYGLPGVLAQIRPYVHGKTALLPFLNGFKHMRDIAEAYPGQPLLGGVARIESTLDASGTIIHMGKHYSFAYGSFENMPDDLYASIKGTLDRTRVLTESRDIRRAMWDKYSFISGLSGLTTLFQATVGEIRDVPGGIGTFRRIYGEIAAIIRASGGTLPEDIEERNTKIIEGLSSASTSSMLRDMRSGLPTEATHLQGYLIELANAVGVSAPLLEVVYQRLAIYENKRG